MGYLPRVTGIESENLIVAPKEVVGGILDFLPHPVQFAEPRDFKARDHGRQRISVSFARH